MCASVCRYVCAGVCAGMCVPVCVCRCVTVCVPVCVCRYKVLLHMASKLLFTFQFWPYLHYRHLDTSPQAQSDRISAQCRPLGKCALRQERNPGDRVPHVVLPTARGTWQFNKTSEGTECREHTNLTEGVTRPRNLYTEERHVLQPSSPSSVALQSL
jgi:hypothetical protein